MKPFFNISYYHDYISPPMAEKLLAQARAVSGVTDLVEVGSGGGLETKESLQFLIELYSKIEAALGKVLAQRIIDRKFIDERVRAFYIFNEELGRDYLDADYKTILGLEDANGRIVIGPKQKNYCHAGGKSIAPIPEFLQGPHVTLFGPPDSAKMALNAMNAYHRKLKDEPAIVEELLSAQDSAPKWGADDEDSKTPLRADLVDAAQNLTACFESTLKVEEAGSSKKYELAKDHLSAPIKRFPGLSLPCTFLFYKKNPIPLHLYDFALHLFRHWKNPKALVFYVPKLENEEEAQYIHTMIATAEAMIKKMHPSYALGTVRLMIVLENPRAILRTHEIMDALYPYFAGASLGWHDYLASTARIFKEDANYRIPVKADPNIVIKYIKASHLLLADVVGPRGGIKVGGMYGVLPLGTDLKGDSFQVTLKGFFKDVITQMKRDLTGYWVAHPDFVRIGLAVVQAWKLYQDGNKDPLFLLVRSLLEKKHHEEMIQFIEGSDIEGLNKNDPHYVRSLLVADMKESDYIANNDPEEIRYNVFQSLQYLTDWLCGNGCVALPSLIGGVPVRVMDDLATAERSRWEVWHELYHGRFSLEEFLKIAQEELHFIRKDLSNEKKIVQVKWDARTEKWYPIAFKLMLRLMTDEKPVEFATELLMPFTVDLVRHANDPWKTVCDLDKEKFKISSEIERFNYFFERCGALRFASTMAQDIALDLEKAKDLVMSFSLEEINEAAYFHGNIGESKKTLDAMASREQALVLQESDSVMKELRELGEKYREKFGFKFLISAKGKSAAEILSAMQARMNHSREQEMQNAREALWEITLKRLSEDPVNTLRDKIITALQKYQITGASIAIANGVNVQSLCFGEAERGSKSVTEETLFELASLSKTIGSAFAIEYFRSKNIPLNSSVNEILAKTKSKFRLKSSKNSAWADVVTLEHLMSHSALNLHYVNGIPANRKMPPIAEFLEGNKEFGYEMIDVVNEPGTKFQYSGGGFIVLEHLLESLEEKPLREMTKNYFSTLALKQLSFVQESEAGKNYAHGYLDSGEEVKATRLMFPAIAAGAMGSSTEMMFFLQHLSCAYHSLEGSGPISHDTAVEMLYGTDKGCMDFMGCKMGLGVFVAEAGDNKLAIHQGANDGFRGIFVHCFDGPDYGKGFTILCNGDNRGVFFNAEVAQELLRVLEFSGIDFSKFKNHFDYKNLAQEQIVNLGYKNLLFDTFLPSLPEEIVKKGPADPLSKYNLLTQAKITRVSNQRFARAENLISAYEPKFDPALFGRQGKIMDSWESARHNQQEYDFLELELPQASEIKYAQVSTKFHDGNQAEFVKILAYSETEKKWKEMIPKIKMEGHSYLQLKLDEATTVSKIQVQMFPDGGLSRLALYKELPADMIPNFKSVVEAKCIRYKDAIPKTKKPLTIPYEASPEEVAKNFSRAQYKNLASLAFGAKLKNASNEHYGPAVQVISPFPPIHMFDGLESARSREPGHFEEVSLRFGKKSLIKTVILDFQFFVNNNPLFVSIHGFDSTEWVELVSKTNVKAFAGNKKEFRISYAQEVEELKVKTYPDGGINRIMVF